MRPTVKTALLAFVMAVTLVPGSAYSIALANPSPQSGTSQSSAPTKPDQKNAGSVDKQNTANSGATKSSGDAAKKEQKK